MGEQETSKPLLKMEMRTANVCTQTLPFLKLVRSDSIDSVAFETSQQQKTTTTKPNRNKTPNKTEVLSTPLKAEKRRNTFYSNEIKHLEMSTVE